MVGLCNGRRDLLVDDGHGLLVWEVALGVQGSRLHELGETAQQLHLITKLLNLSLGRLHM